MAFSVGWYLVPDAKVEIENSILAGRGAMAIVRSTPLDEERPSRLEANQSTFVGNMAMRYDAFMAQTEDGRTRFGDEPTLEVSIFDSIIDVEHMMVMMATPVRFMPRQQVEDRLLQTVLHWDESGNFYRAGMEMAIAPRQRLFLSSWR